MQRPPESSLPLKTSVSAVVKQMRQAEDDWESPADKRIMQEESPVPSFLAQSQLTPAQRGTVTHRILGLVELESMARGDYRKALDDLQQQNLLSHPERQAVRIPWLKGFFESELGRRMLSSPEIHREWAFNLSGPEDTLIQGVLDLCFREGEEWVLVDYKTDQAEDGEILERYRLQMQWYKRALENITGRKVKETYLFALRSGHAIFVE